MSLFKKKETAAEAACCCGKNCMPEDIEKAESARGDGARIKILGSGCAKCQALESATKDALRNILPVPRGFPKRFSREKSLQTRKEEIGQETFSGPRSFLSQ